jgi:glycosyltransferase involved in cell wall biosynthesis
MKRNLLFVISKISKVIFYEWLAEELSRELFQVTYVVMNDTPTEVEEALRKKGQTFYHIHYKNKLNMPGAIRRLVRIIRQEKIDVIHAHLLDATLAALIAGKFAGTRKRIFTRHHSNYHKVYHRKGVFYDKFCNLLATDIISITDMVTKHLLEEGAPAEKIHLICHGFKLEVYGTCSEEQKVAFRKKYGLSEDQTIIGVVSRYTLWKGVQYIIPAFKEFLKTNPRAVLLLANATGNDQVYLKSLLAELPPENIREIVYERDMPAFYHSLNIFVHVPIDPDSEAFGQAYVEALAAGVPSIFTKSGIANDFVVDRVHALVVPFKDQQSILAAMVELQNDVALLNRLIPEGQKAVSEKFSLKTMVTKLEDLYLAK